MGLKKEEITDLIEYRVKKSKEVFIEAEDVARLNHWNLAVNRLYYSIFHACNALVLSKNYSARTHNGVIRIMMLEFIQPGILSKEEGKLITTLFNMRNTGDYDDLYDWDEHQVKPLIKPVESLLSKLYNLISYP